MIEIIKKLPDAFFDNPFFIKIAAYFNAFAGYENLGDFYVQRDENGGLKALISVIGSQATVFNNGMQTTEIREFLRAIRPLEIFTDIYSAEELNLSVIKKRSIFKYQKTGTQIAPENCRVTELYDRLNACFKIADKHSFCADVSHMIRHSSALSVVENYGAALLLFYKSGSFLSAICVNAGERKKGYGSDILKKIKDTAPEGNIYTVAESGTNKFYESNGFGFAGTAAYCEVI